MFQFMAGGRDFCPVYSHQPGVYPVSCSLGNGGTFLVIKQPGCEVDHSACLVPRLIISGTTLTAVYAFMVCTGTDTKIKNPFKHKL